MYDAYGRVIGRSNPATPATGPPELRVGHKGLFFDRLDWGIVDPLTLEETPRLEPGATLLGYNRNRTLHVGWGRFLQRDPNATWLPVHAGLVSHGIAMVASVDDVDLCDNLLDGSNTYQYLRSDPLRGTDPSGLFFSIGEAFGATATAVDIYQDHSDEVITTGRSALDFIYHTMANYGDEVWLKAEIVGIWDVSDDHFLPSAFVHHESDDEAEAGSQWAVADAHRLLPGFSGGKYVGWNVSDVAPMLHRELHKIMRAQFAAQGLMMPSRGFNGKAWRKWMRQNPANAAKYRAAIEGTARAFDLREDVEKGILDKTLAALKKNPTPWAPKKKKKKPRP